MMKKSCDENKIDKEENNINNKDKAKKVKKEKLCLFDDIRKIPGIGDATAERLSVLGIFFVKDILTYFPRECEDRREIRQICDIIPNESNTFNATVIKSPITIKAGRYKITKVEVSDLTGKCTITWFNQPYMASKFKVGDEFTFVGKVKQNYGRLECTTPQYERIGSNSNLMTGQIVPKYGLTRRINQNSLIRIIKKALDEASDALKRDIIPEDIRKEYDLCDYEYAINNIHFPKDNDAYLIAKKRLVFEELFILQLALTLIRNKVKKEQKKIKFERINMNELYDMLPFSLTNAQQRVINEIESDMTSSFSMNRLVQGDVGSGKTVCALAAMFIAARNGYQSVLMAPTEVLATQHYEFFKEYASKLGLSVRLLVGSTKKSEKEEIYAQLENGEIDFLIGTHAVIQDTVKFKNFGLAITDEQHRFGVDQRMTLNKKGAPDVLVMTATPIPRTLGMILYGDLDISIIDELPKGRQKIDTCVVGTSYYERMYSFIREQIKEGRQAYVICPMVEESENEEMSELSAVTTYTEMISEKYLQNERVRYIHGKMKAKEKNYIMEDFMNGKIDVLVSTTVIEVGINNPNASIMVIENAERFGLSQLHQLRGRVGRGEYKSYCILISDSKTSTARKRLATIKATDDGFKIAEKDLELRGPGEFFGTRQHGTPEFKIANLYEDIEVLKEAQEAVAKLLDIDFLLEKEENSMLKEEAMKILDYQTL